MTTHLKTRGFCFFIILAVSCGQPLDLQSKTKCEKTTDCLEGTSCIAGTCIAGKCDERMGFRDARTALELAKAKALTLSSDVQLVSLGARPSPNTNVPTKVIGTDGKLLFGNTAFSFNFSSVSKGKTFSIEVPNNTGPIEVVDEFGPDSNVIIGDTWINSPEAMKVAEQHGGCVYREGHPDSTNWAGMGTIDGQLKWVVGYASADGGSQIGIFIDATTGAFLSKVDL